METILRLRERVLKAPHAGITMPPAEFEQQRVRLVRELHVLNFKMERTADLLPFIVFQGGTGTGKSSIFNSLLGYPLSRTGAERPQTLHPIVLAPRRSVALFREAELLPDMPSHWYDIRSMAGRFHDEPGFVVYVSHDFEAWRDYVLVDSPDMDSVVQANRLLAEDLYALADLVIFVTSQEKYADKRPFEWFRKAERQGKPYWLILNKVEGVNGVADFEGKLRSYGQASRQGLLVLPRVPRDDPSLFSSLELSQIMDRFSDLDAEVLKRQGLHSLQRAVEERLSHVRTVLEEESLVRERLNSGVGEILERAGDRLTSSLSWNLDKETRTKLKKQIHFLLRRYDVFRKPRRWLRELLLLPFSMVGWRIPRKPSEEVEELKKVIHGFPSEPMEQVAVFMQHELSSLLRREAPSTALYADLVDSGVFWDRQELRNRCRDELDGLEVWLQGRFELLKKGLTPQRKAGLVSMSVLWGVMLISIETVIGGGITLLEILLDTVIVPFIPRGVLELAVYDEIKKIGRELDTRYKTAYLTVLGEQGERALAFLESRFVTPEDLNVFRQGTGILPSGG